MNYTSIEQSKKLLEFGLDANTADFHCIDDHYNIPEVIAGFCNGWYEDYKESDRDYIPIWSVGALLELANRGACSDEMVVLEINSYLLNPGAHIYIDNTEPGHITRGNYIGKSIMEVVYDFVVWLLENNYIKH